MIMILLVGLLKGLTVRNRGSASDDDFIVDSFCFAVSVLALLCNSKMLIYNAMFAFCRISILILPELSKGRKKRALPQISNIIPSLNAYSYGVSLFLQFASATYI